MKKDTLDRFVRLGGYAIVKQKKGKWKNISLASKKTGLSRQTIYTILKNHPQPPSKTKPKYVEEFEESEGYKLLKDLYEKTVAPRTFKHRLSHIMDAWKALNKKDPISWSESDFKKIWNMEQFMAEGIGFEEHYASSFHVLMKLIDRHDLIPKFRGHKQPAGKKKHWFLHDPEIITMIPCFNEIDTMLFTYSGMVWGARASAMLGVKVKDIYFEDHTVQIYEPKTKQYVSKYPPISLFRLLKRYIKDFNLKPEDKIFPRSYDHYNQRLAEVGKCANLKKTLSTHILKHTFVSQGHRHGLSRETVVDMTGTEDRTIKRYYLSLDEKKIRHETQGLELDVIPFHVWVEGLHAYFEKRYGQLFMEKELVKNA